MVEDFHGEVVGVVILVELGARKVGLEGHEIRRMVTGRVGEDGLGEVDDEGIAVGDVKQLNERACAQV